MTLQAKISYSPSCDFTYLMKSAFTTIHIVPLVDVSSSADVVLGRLSVVTGSGVLVKASVLVSEGASVVASADNVEDGVSAVAERLMTKWHTTHHTSVCNAFPVHRNI